MNGLSFSELCCLFCCPPCPGRIAAKLAFLPPEPTYELTEQLDDDEDEPPQQTSPPPPPSAKRPASGRKTAKAAAWTASIAAADAARAASLEARANANGRATTGKDKDGAAGVTTRNQADGKSKTSDATTTTTTPATNSPATAKKGHNTNNCSANNAAASTASNDKTASKTAAKKASTTKTKTATTTETAAASADKPKHARYKLKLFERAEWAYSDREKDKVEVFFAQTTRGNRIACMHIRCAPNARYTLLFSHGNAVDLGQMSSFYLGLGARINCNIFSYDYSGYGHSDGKPSEKNLYADIDAAYFALLTRYNIAAEHVILYGQSIGTVPTVDLATKHDVGAVILHSPLMSGMRVAFPNTKRTWFFDVFPSIDKVPKVQSPVLVIHGTDDEVIDFSHGISIYERCPRAVEPLWVEGAGHNDVELYMQYLDRLKQFLTVELVN